MKCEKAIRRWPFCADRYTPDGFKYDVLRYKYQTQDGTGRLQRNRLYHVYSDHDAPVSRFQPDSGRWPADVKRSSGAGVWVS